MDPGSSAGPRRGHFPQVERVVRNWKRPQLGRSAAAMTPVVGRSLPGGRLVRSKRQTRVAILSSPGFVAGAVDSVTVTLAGAGVWKSLLPGKLRDVDGDGDLDLVLCLRTRRLRIGARRTTAELTGMTYAGERIVGYGRARFVR